MNKITDILRSRLLVAVGLSACAPACGSSSSSDANTPGAGRASGTGGGGGQSATGGSGGGAAAEAGHAGQAQAAMGGTGGSAGGAAGQGGSAAGAAGRAPGGAGGVAAGRGGEAGRAQAGGGGHAAAGASGKGGAGAGGAGGSGGAGSSAGGTAGTFPSVRRPFLVGASLRSSSVAERDDWHAALAPRELGDVHAADALAAAWLKDALEEHASVAAFARFSMLLLSVGAPPELIVASQRASLDEVEHARACFALARRYGGRDVGPGPLSVDNSVHTLSLADLAGLTVTEGCVGETLGALMAVDQLTRASDPEVARILRRIAKDEARHAELAWKFLAWALAQGQPDVELAARRALDAATDELDAMRIVDYGVDLELWHAHGRMTCAEARELGHAGIREVVRPCLEALLDQAQLGGWRRVNDRQQDRKSLAPH
jgi:hypothetical protein